MRSRLVLFIAYAIVLSGCGYETEQTANTEAVSGQSGIESGSEHPAKTAANKILTALRNSDSVAIKSFFNETNREKIGDEQLFELFSAAKEMIGDVTAVSELRKGLGPNVFLAKIREVGREVYVIALTEENGEYLLEDINSPAADDYQIMPLIDD